ncbi:MAG TPA: phosphate ABC transporter substrate-binding protein [Kofleriaceae bacterium]|nr:phosphate ABC transporter substrate-binding protein [Kofleriaceae bacterium]
MKKILVPVALLGGLALAGYLLFGRSSGAKQQITLTGSSSIAPLMLEIAKRYESQHPDVRIDVQAGGSGRGISDPRQGLADIGMVSRSLKPEESDLKSFTIALDGISVIIHKSNPIEALTDEQIVDIYKGKITNWSMVGGADAPITVINKADGRSTLELFLKHFGLNAKDVKAQVVIGDNEQGIKTLVGNPNAIAYVSIGTAEYGASRGAALKLLPSRGVPATIEAVRAGTYPLRRPLNLTTREEPTGIVKDLIEFSRSAQVHDLLQGQYLVAPGS